MVDGKLVAMPWFADAGLLYYRKDLLEKYNRPAPQTWADLTATAQTIQEGERKAGRAEFWGFVWQGRAYEGLTTNALEWVASHGGGTIVDGKGEVTINNPKAMEALKVAAAWVGKITPPGVLNYQRGRGTRRIPGRQCGLHAQLALCLGAGARRRQSGQGQGRHRPAAEGRR